MILIGFIYNIKILIIKQVNKWFVSFCLYNRPIFFILTTSDYHNGMCIIYQFLWFLDYYIPYPAPLLLYFFVNYLHNPKLP